MRSSYHSIWTVGGRKRATFWNLNDRSYAKEQITSQSCRNVHWMWFCSAFQNLTFCATLVPAAGDLGSLAWSCSNPTLLLPTSILRRLQDGSRLVVTWCILLCRMRKVYFWVGAWRLIPTQNGNEWEIPLLLFPRVLSLLGNESCLMFLWG